MISSVSIILWVLGLAINLASSFHSTFPFIRHVSSNSFSSHNTIHFLSMKDEDNIMQEANLPAEEDLVLTAQDMEVMTVAQLKQQLRLRGLPVSGIKSELIQRLLRLSSGATNTVQSRTNQPMDVEFTKAFQFANERGKELINITDYLDPDDKNKATKSSKKDDSSKDESSNTSDDTGPETWGSEARIVEDYEGRSPVVDSLSRTVVEYKGSMNSMVQAFVVASRDALQGFLAGRARITTDVEERLLEIQTKREKASHIPIRLDQEDGMDEGDEKGIYTQVMDRDYSDWGKYTTTGAQLSAQEVQGVLLLSDIYGAFTNDTRALAEKIAFECQPVVVMVPDMFQGDPWEQVEGNKNAKGQTYEQWRAQQDSLRVSVDIRAAAECLRDQYGVSSVVVWGTCFGGGRALEAAAGYFPNDIVHDLDGSIGPPAVNPNVCVAWYPTKYNAKALFGKSHQTNSDQSVAVIAIFGERDELEGATQQDAATLKQLFAEDSRIKDHMVKVFPDQGHGFAHIGLSHDISEDKDPMERFVDNEFGGAGRVALDSGDAEIACLLSTAFMETYSRIFLPTVGPAISMNNGEDDEWSSLTMKDLKQANSRNIREEIETALDTLVDRPATGIEIDRFDEEQHDELKRILMSYQSEDVKGPLKITEEDDLVTAYEKLTAWDANVEIF